MGVEAFGGSTVASVFVGTEEEGPWVAPGSCLRLHEQSYVTC